MPRSKQSQEGRILEYFRHGEAAEVKVIAKLAQDIVRERFAEPAPAKARRTRKSKAAPAAQSTREVSQ